MSKKKLTRMTLYHAVTAELIKDRAAGLETPFLAAFNAVNRIKGLYTYKPPLLRAIENYCHKDFDKLMTAQDWGNIRLLYVIELDEIANNFTVDYMSLYNNVTRRLDEELRVSLGGVTFKEVHTMINFTPINCLHKGELMETVTEYCGGNFDQRCDSQDWVNIRGLYLMKIKHQR